MTETIVEHLQASGATMRAVQLRVLGGAMARVPAQATAFADRDRRSMANVAAFYERPQCQPVREAWVANFAATLRQGVNPAPTSASSATRARSAPSPQVSRHISTSPRLS